MEMQQHSCRNSGFNVRKRKKEIVTLIDDIQEEYQDIVLSSSHYYLNSDIHLVVVTIKGKAVRLTEFSDKLITIKGIKHGKLAMSRAE
jgi:CopG family nickel-responsive transcriptional regulator